MINTIQQPTTIIEDLILIDKLGEGSFGEVYLTKKQQFPHMLFATKKVNNSKAFDEKNRKYFNNELYILRNLSHPNIIQLYEIKRTQNNFYLVFDYCNGGTLNSCLKKYQNLYNRTFTEIECQYLIKQITNGLSYLSRCNIIHRDLKMDNVMLNFKSEEDKVKLNMIKAEVKIIDFGFAKYLEQNDLANSILGSPLNMDPILLGGIINKNQSATYDEKADIWSLGTICYNILIGYPPFQASAYKELLDLINKGEYSIPLSLKLSKQAISFLVSILQNDPKQRFDIHALSNHEFLIENQKYDTISINTIPGNYISNGELKLSTLKKDYTFLFSNYTNLIDNKEEDNKLGGEFTYNNLYLYNRFNETKGKSSNSDESKRMSVTRQNSIIPEFKIISPNKAIVPSDTNKFNSHKQLDEVCSKALLLFDKMNKTTSKIEPMIFPCYIDTDTYLKNLKLA